MRAGIRAAQIQRARGGIVVGADLRARDIGAQRFAGVVGLFVQLHAGTVQIGRVVDDQIGRDNERRLFGESCGEVGARCVAVEIKNDIDQLRFVSARIVIAAARARHAALIGGDACHWRRQIQSGAADATKRA